MNPSRELDALIAEKVMGCKVKPGEIDIKCGCEITKHNDYDYEGAAHTPNFSTDIGAAWQVVEKLNQRDPSISTGEFELKFWGDKWDAKCSDSIRVYDDESGIPSYKVKEFVGTADTAPHAVCLAALKVIDSK